MNDIIDLAEGLEELHDKWQPLDWQVPLGRAIFYEGKKDIGAQCGRSTGKTEIASYISWRYAYENPGSENYLIEPLFNQGREILWASNRLQDFGPQNWIESVNNTECRITFTNKSFIKLEGSDNVDKLRGVKPKGVVIWDELKDIKPAAIAAMDPNRARYNVPALYLGTPPEFHNHYVDIMEALKVNPKAYWCRADSFANKWNSVEWLQTKKDALFKAGNQEEWYREFEAMFVKGGKRAIFPQFFKYKPKSFDALWPNDIHHWQLLVSFDPGSSTTFAVGFFLFNPYSKRILLMDEIYEQNMGSMTTRSIWAQVESIMQKYKQVKQVRWIYDEAALWFKNELSEHAPSVWLEPTQKALNSIEHGIGLIRDVFTYEKIEIAEHCVKTIWELENYIKDEKGKLPVVNDHMIDNVRYTLEALGYEFKDMAIPREADPDTQRRGYSLEEDLAAMGRMGFQEID